MSNPVVKLLGTLGSIVGIQLLINDERLIVRPGVKVEACWCTVMMVHHVSENLGILPQSFPIRSLDPFHGRRLKTLLLFLVVLPREKPGVEAHLREKTRICIRVTEWVDLPADSRFDAEFLKHKLVTELHVGDHVLVMGASFVVHGPTSINNFETALRYECAHILLHSVSLFIPPHGEELHLNVGELLDWVEKKMFNHGIED